MILEKKLPGRKYCCMKNRDRIILKKILDYCKQLQEACEMFDNDYNTFIDNSVFETLAACVFCK